MGCAPLVLKVDGPRSDEAFDPTYAPDRVLEDGEAMRGTGWTLSAVATPGHTSNHLCFALKESGSLFTGDHVMGWSTSVVIPPDGDMGDYMASLEKLQRRDDKIYHSAHGAAITKPKQLVRGIVQTTLQTSEPFHIDLHQNTFCFHELHAAVTHKQPPR